MTPVATAPSPTRTREDAETERLYAEYSDRIQAYCLRRLGCRSEAEDALQMTFLYAFRALRRGVVPEFESAWLHAIARNVCRWQQRTASRRPISGAADVESVACLEPNDESELLAGLHDALESIPERQRQALLLREWRGCSMDEIAEHLELSPPATHALLTRARRSLVQALTAPRRAALGLASIVYELRSTMKTLLGGASAKVALATVAIMSAGAGAVVADRALARGDVAPAPAARLVDQGVEHPRSLPAGSPASGRASMVIEPQRGEGAMPSSGRSAPFRFGARTASMRPFAPSAPQAGGEDASEPEAEHDTSSPASELPTELLVELLTEVPPAPEADLPPLPELELPSDVLPPLELPSDALPPIEVPTDVLPVDPPPLPPLPELPLDDPAAPPVPELSDLLP